MSGRIGAAVRRSAWTVADSALWSMSTFALLVVAARESSPAVFGAFALFVGMATLGVSLARAVLGEPYAVRFAGVPEPDRAAAAAQVLAAGVVGAVILGGLGVLLSVGGAVPIGYRAPCLVLAVCLPGMLLQDTLRQVFIAVGRGRTAFLNDLSYACLMLAALAFLVATDNATLPYLLAAWAGPRLVAGVGGLVQLGTVPDFTAWRGWLGVSRRLGAPFLAEAVLVTGVAQVSMLVIGALASLEAVGHWRGALTVYGPLTAVLGGMQVAAIPEAVRARAAGPGPLRRVLRRVVTAAVLVSLVWGLVGALLPDQVGRALLGETWVGSKGVVLRLVPVRVAAAVTLGAFVGLRSSRSVARSLGARLTVGLASLGGVVIGLALDGVDGAALGLGTAVSLGSVLWWRQFIASERQAAPVPVPARGPDASG